MVEMRRPCEARSPTANATTGERGQPTVDDPDRSDQEVCLCFRVSQRKLVNYMRREHPRVASQLSECLGAGTGCGWCVPFLRLLHRQFEAGMEPGLPFAPAEYAARRRRFRDQGDHQADDLSPAAEKNPEPGLERPADDAVTE